MAFTNVPTGVNGSTVWNEFAWNAYLKDNFADHQTRLNALEVGGPSESALFSMSADRGDAAVALTAADERTQLFNTPLTATRVVTLIQTGGSTFDGIRFRIVRGPGATGAFNLEVRRFDAVLLATLDSASQSVEVIHDGISWKVTDFVSGTGGGGGVSTAAEVVALFTGTPDGTLFLRDDGTLAAPATTTQDIYGQIPILLPGSGITGGSSATAHEFATVTTQRIRADLTGVTEIELDATVTVAATGGQMGIQYTTDLTGATGWANFDATSATTVGAPKISLGTVANTVTSGVQAVPGGAQAPVLLRLWLTGDGTNNPAVMAVRARVKRPITVSGGTGGGGGAGSQIWRTGMDGALSTTRSEDRVIGWTGDVTKIIAHLGARSTSGNVVVSLYYADTGNTPGAATTTITIPASAGGTAGSATAAVAVDIIETGQIAYAVTSLGTGAQDLELILKGTGT